MKKRFLFNPILIVLTMTIAFAAGIFADIIEKPGRSYSFMSPGLTICALSFICISRAYIYFFLGRLAKLFPEKQTEIFEVRKWHFFMFRKYEKLLDEKSLTMRNTVLYFLEGRGELQWIDAEWQLGIKALTWALISVFLFYPFKLVIAGWIPAVRPAVLEWLGSIRF